MCKNVVLVVASSSPLKKDEINYMRYVKEKILATENGKKLHFVFGQNDIKLTRGSIIKKVVFDLGGSKNEPIVIAGIKKSVIKINKEYVPVYLRINKGKDEFGCTSIENLELVRSFNPNDVPCHMMATVV